MGGLTEWIPCSKRLPEDSSEVLVTYKSLQHGELKVGKDRYRKYVNFNDFYWQGKGNRVVAWMPLPEPYNLKRKGENG